MNKIKPVSKTTYDNYVKIYKQASKTTPMDNALLTMDEFSFAVQEMRGKGIKNIARFIAYSQKTYSTSRGRATKKFAQNMWEELKSEKYPLIDEAGNFIIDKKTGEIKMGSRLEDFKKRFPMFQKKSDLRTREILEKRDELFSYFREELGYSNDDIDRLFSPEEEEIA